MLTCSKFLSVLIRLASFSVVEGCVENVFEVVLLRNLHEHVEVHVDTAVDNVDRCPSSCLCPANSDHIGSEHD